MEPGAGLAADPMNLTDTILEYLPNGTCTTGVQVPVAYRAQQWFSHQLFLQCLSAMCNTSSPRSGDRRCPPMFDGWGCWPSTEANKSVTIPCPVHNHLYTVPVVTHHCVGSSGDASWARNPAAVIYTDYSSCDRIAEPTTYELELTIYFIGFILSLISCSLAFAIFVVFKKLKCARNSIHMHFFISMCTVAIMYFVQTGLTVDTFVQQFQESAACSIVWVLYCYAQEATFFWMLSEAAFLHQTVVTNVFSANDNIKPFIAIGWGAPLLIVAAYIAAVLIFSGQDPSTCWAILDETTHLNYIVTAPMPICTIVNLALMANVLRVLIPKINASGQIQNHQVAMKSAKAIIFLAPLFGCHTILSIYMPDESSPYHHVILTIQAVTQSTQGFFVACIFCFSNSEVRTEARKVLLESKLNKLMPDRFNVSSVTISLTSSGV